MKKTLLITSVACALVSAVQADAADMIEIKGEACEKYVEGQSKSSIRVRVTDKASYNAVSQIESLVDLHSQMLEHDFNIIVYNLVDNYVQNLMVNTTNQNKDELCVQVTGSIPATDITTVIANYSPNNPAPEYDIKDAAGITEEVLDEPEEKVADQEEIAPSEVLYDGKEEIESEQKQALMQKEEFENTEVLYSGTENELDSDLEEELMADESLGELPPPPASDEEDLLTVEEGTPSVDEVEEGNAVAPKAFAEQKAYVYVAPVAFNNNTHSSKSAQVLKDMFADTLEYQLTNNPAKALYVLEPHVLKAKIDALNTKTKRIQMVVSLQLSQPNSSISYSEHQNRFVLFENGESEQEIAQKLLHKLLRNSGRKLFAKIETAEKKRKEKLGM